MGLRARNEREKENMEKMILVAAAELIITDGMINCLCEK